MISIAENRVESADCAGVVGERVGKAKGLKSGNHRHEFLKSACLDGSVDVAGIIANSDSHDVAAAIAGGSLDQSKNCDIVACWWNSFNGRGSHGCSFVVYAEKYARTVIHSSGGVPA